MSGSEREGQVTHVHNEDLVRLFLEKVDPKTESYWERTEELVLLAAERRHKSIVRMLLRYGAAVYIPMSGQSIHR